MGNVKITYELLNQIAGSMKNLAVDLAAKQTWEEDLAELAGDVWSNGYGNRVREAIENMNGDWDYARSVYAAQAMTAAMKADIIGQAWADWDASGVGERGKTALSPGDWKAAGGDR